MSASRAVHTVQAGNRRQTLGALTTQGLAPRRKNDRQSPRSHRPSRGRLIGLRACRRVSTPDACSGLLRTRSEESPRSDGREQRPRRVGVRISLCNLYKLLFLGAVGCVVYDRWVHCVCDPVANHGGTGLRSVSASFSFTLKRLALTAALRDNTKTSAPSAETTLRWDVKLQSRPFIADQGGLMRSLNERESIMQNYDDGVRNWNTFQHGEVSEPMAFRGHPPTVGWGLLWTTSRESTHRENYDESERRGTSRTLEHLGALCAKGIYAEFHRRRCDPSLMDATLEFGDGRGSTSEGLSATQAALSGKLPVALCEQCAREASGPHAINVGWARYQGLWHAPLQ